MSATLLSLPVIFILFGVACLIFPQQLGVGFCKLGKWIWKTSTFGLTDMRWFYPEERAPSLFRIFGAFFLVGGIVFMALYFLSFSGPGSLFAMREAGIYLDDLYGDSGGNWSISASKDNEDSRIVTVTYRHGNNSGTLKGEWDGQKYVFSKQE